MCYVARSKEHFLNSISCCGLEGIFSWETGAKWPFVVASPIKWASVVCLLDRTRWSGFLCEIHKWHLSSNPISAAGTTSLNHPWGVRVVYIFIYQHLVLHSWHKPSWRKTNVELWHQLHLWNVGELLRHLQCHAICLGNGSQKCPWFRLSWQERSSRHHKAKLRVPNQSGHTTLYPGACEEICILQREGAGCHSCRRTMIWIKVRRSI